MGERYEVVEHVARAMAGAPWSDLSDQDQTFWVHRARAAIQAMRDPAAEMLLQARTAALEECVESLDVAERILTRERFPIARRVVGEAAQRARQALEER